MASVANHPDLQALTMRRARVMKADRVALTPAKYSLRILKEVSGMKRAKPRSLPARATACISRISLSSLLLCGGALKSCIEGAQGLSIGRPVLSFSPAPGRQTHLVHVLCEQFHQDNGYCKGYKDPVADRLVQH